MKPPKRPERKGAIAQSVHRLAHPDELDSNPDELNNRERLFVSHYVETGRAGDAAEKAGYARSVAGKLLQRPRIVVAVRAAYEGDPGICSAAERLRIRSDIARDTTAQPHARLQAVNDLDRQLGTIEPEQVEVNVRVDPRVRSMSTVEQLEYLLAKAGKT